LLFLYHFSCIDVSFYSLVHYTFSRVSKWLTSTILDFEIFAIFVKKNQITVYFYVHTHNLAEIGRSTVVLLRIFDFKNGGRPSSWIWYDVSDHPRLMFDCPNILLKSHVDRVYTLQDMTIFIFDWCGSKFPIHPILGEFGGYCPQMNSGIVATPKRTILGRKHVVRTINRENPATGSTWARAREKYTIT